MNINNFLHFSDIYFWFCRPNYLILNLKIFNSEKKIMLFSFFFLQFFYICFFKVYFYFIKFVKFINVIYCLTFPSFFFSVYCVPECFVITNYVIPVWKRGNSALRLADGLLKVSAIFLNFLKFFYSWSYTEVLQYVIKSHRMCWCYRFFISCWFCIKWYFAETHKRWGYWDALSSCVFG